ncbi:MAG: dTMP kinase [Eggerthia catenaformis]|uniref:dTMP kinase n=1 Tax=Eggerthia catenaformis TaxID=31973 RepID=UPI003C6F59B0
MSGKFITFEGGEGSGKTTVAKMIEEALSQDGYQVLLTREPGGVKIAEEIRNIIVDEKNSCIDPKTEALLFAASRRQHLIEKVKPVLDHGGIVICDRFIDSSLVYQGIGRNLGIDKVYQMNLFATEGIMPDKTFFFNIKPEIALKRLKTDESREVNRLDLESLEFHQKVYEGYCLIAQRYKDRIVSIDASGSIKEVFKTIYQQIKLEL